MLGKAIVNFVSDTHVPECLTNLIAHIDNKQVLALSRSQASKSERYRRLRFRVLTRKHAAKRAIALDLLDTFQPACAIKPTGSLRVGRAASLSPATLGSLVRIRKD